jgi:hypothetical protein
LFHLASAGLVPFKSSAALVRAFVGEQGVFAVNMVDGPERRYLIHCVLGFEPDWLQAIGSHSYEDLWKIHLLPLGAAGVFLHRQMAPPPTLVVPDAYRVFRYFPHSASIVTTNYDRQTNYCPQRAIAIHGC